MRRFVAGCCGGSGGYAFRRNGLRVITVIKAFTDWISRNEEWEALHHHTACRRLDLAWSSGCIIRVNGVLRSESIF